MLPGPAFDRRHLPVRDPEDQHALAGHSLVKVEPGAALDQVQHFLRRTLARQQRVLIATAAWAAAVGPAPCGSPCLIHDRARCLECTHHHGASTGCCCRGWRRSTVGLGRRGTVLLRGRSGGIDGIGWRSGDGGGSGDRLAPQRRAPDFDGEGRPDDWSGAGPDTVPADRAERLCCLKTWTEHITKKTKKTSDRKHRSARDKHGHEEEHTTRRARGGTAP